MLRGYSAKTFGVLKMLTKNTPRKKLFYMKNQGNRLLMKKIPLIYGSFISILPGIGYYYNMKSEDKVNINHWEYGYSLKSIFKVTQNGSIFIEGFYANSLQLVAGIHFKFD